MSDVLKAEEIIQELIRRLKSGFGRTHLERGFYEDGETIYPSMYVFEAPEESEKHATQQRGMYKHALPVIITYFFKGGDTSHETAERAALELRKLRYTIEQDEEFLGLCNDYGVVETVRIPLPENAMQVVVTYIFYYGEYAPWWRKQKRRK